MLRIFALLFALALPGAALGQSGLAGQNQLWAGPTSGGSGFGQWRAAVAADLPATSVQSVVNDTNIQGAISAQALTFSWAGTLSVARGGTGGGAASGTLLDNITGFSSTGFLARTGAGTYSFTATAGVDANLPLNLAISGNVLTSYCEDTVNLTGTNTILTFPSVAGFAATCSLKVTNASATAGQQIVGLTGITKLYPSKNFGAKIVNGAWALFDAPTRYLIPNGSTGNVYANDSATGCSGAPCLDTNDCLSAATACATFAQMMTDAATNIDNEGTLAYNVVAGTTWTNTPFIAQQTVGTGLNVLIGNNVASPNITLTCNADCGSGTNNCIICFERIRGKWQIFGFAFSTTGTATSTTHILVQGSELTLQFGNLSFGASAGSNAHIFCQYGSSVDNIGNYKITAGAANHLSSTNDCVIHVRTNAVAVTGVPAFTTFALAHNGGIIGLGNVFGGAAVATGQQCSSDGNSIIDTGGTFAAAIPGSTPCVVATGGIVE